MSEEKVEEVETKPWWKSKTLWANIIGIGLLVGKYFGLLGDADIPAEYAVSGVFAFIANIILRIITKKKVVG